MNENQLNIEFGVPEHGWLTVSLQFENYKLEIDASDVPHDPIEQLCSSLIILGHNVTTPPEVMWHLEPFCYYFVFEGDLDRSRFRLKIYSSDNYEGPKRFEKTIEGNYSEIIMPIYRALKRFGAAKYRDPHWPEIGDSRLEKLKTAIKSKEKTHNKP